MEIRGYKYNSKVGNFCKKGLFGFVKPFEGLRMRDMKEHEMGQAVSYVHFNRTGKIDWRIEGDKDYAKKIAQELGVW